MGTHLSHIAKEIKNGAIILDIRTKDEYCSGHLCGAINVPTPLPPLNEVNIYHLNRDLSSIWLNNRESSTFIVYCKKGIRAKQASKILKRYNVKVINLGGVLDSPLKSIISGEKEIPYLKVCRC